MRSVSARLARLLAVPISHAAAPTKALRRVTAWTDEQNDHLRELRTAAAAASVEVRHHPFMTAAQADGRYCPAEPALRAAAFEPTAVAEDV